VLTFWEFMALMFGPAAVYVLVCGPFWIVEWRDQRRRDEWVRYELALLRARRARLDRAQYEEE
jgi:hypothetical protein